MESVTSEKLLASFEQDLRQYARAHALAGSENLSVGTNHLTVDEKGLVGSTYNAVVAMLNDASCYGNNPYTSEFYVDRSSMESFMQGVNFDQSKFSAIMDQLSNLCDVAKVPQKDRLETMRGLGQTLHRYLNRTVGFEHWATSANSDTKTMSDIYPMAALSDVSFGNTMPGAEAFGASIDTVLPDIRMAMTVVLLKPHKGIMSRLIHRRTLAGSVIQYVVHKDEFYDLTKSQAATGAVRNSYDHRYPLVSLYRKPDPINMTLAPIVPAKANDTTNEFLVADGVMKFNVDVDMFDMSMDPSKVGYNAINYTDLVSDGVIYKGLILDIANAAGTTTERVYVATEGLSAARFTMQPNTPDSAERSMQLRFRMPLTAATKLANGNSNTLFAAVAGGTALVEAVIAVSGNISLKTAISHSHGSVKLVARSLVDGVAVPAPITALVEGASAYTVKLVGYELDAKFSEENLRKVNMAVRTQTYTAMYELPQGKSIVVDFSMQQSVPEHVLNTAQEVQAIGIDHRNLQAFLKLLRYVYDARKIEDADPNYRTVNQDRTLNTAYVSGQRINPHVVIGTIDLSKVTSVRSSDMLSDVRQYVDSYLNKVIAQLHLQTLYVQQLENGEIPTYKVLTTSPIIETLLSVPHIHNHLHPAGMDAERIFKEKTPGEPIEFVRVLPSGVKLECISTAFEYMADKIMIIPFRSSDPASELNFAHNWDGGQFVANYTPVDGNQVNKRVFMNTREFPIPTCPIGALITIKDWAKKLPDITTP